MGFMERRVEELGAIEDLLIKNPGLTLGEITRAACIPKGFVRRCLRALSEHGRVRKLDGDPARWRVDG